MSPYLKFKFHFIKTNFNRYRNPLLDLLTTTSLLLKINKKLSFQRTIIFSILNSPLPCVVHPEFWIMWISVPTVMTYTYVPLQHISDIRNRKMFVFHVGKWPLLQIDRTPCILPPSPNSQSMVNFGLRGKKLMQWQWCVCFSHEIYYWS